MLWHVELRWMNICMQQNHYAEFYSTFYVMCEFRPRYLLH
uniref:Uncharacterized protein n=1 Tax=Rhizophora mucronata TaxID=61149 RepID=A0A2P2QQE1_RHIMU